MLRWGLARRRGHAHWPLHLLYLLNWPAVPAAAVRRVGVLRPRALTLGHTPELVWVLDLLRPLSTVFMFRMFQVQCAWAVAVWRRQAGHPHEYPGPKTPDAGDTNVIDRASRGTDHGHAGANGPAAPMPRVRLSNQSASSPRESNGSATLQKARARGLALRSRDFGHIGVVCGCLMGSLMAVEVRAVPRCL